MAAEFLPSMVSTPSFHACINRPTLHSNSAGPLYKTSVHRRIAHSSTLPPIGIDTDDGRLRRGGDIDQQVWNASGRRPRRVECVVLPLIALKGTMGVERDPLRRVPPAPVPAPSGRWDSVFYFPSASSNAYRSPPPPPPPTPTLNLGMRAGADSVSSSAS
ncbi:hypothetical protein K525DRAFT_272465 [Schizophyllum commune Loenen D]|nr:hypothetical protein K525DRAFT_272465 [Schizophyllum commune Loenen D]